MIQDVVAGGSGGLGPYVDLELKMVEARAKVAMQSDAGVSGPDQGHYPYARQVRTGWYHDAAGQSFWTPPVQGATLSKASASSIVEGERFLAEHAPLQESSAGTVIVEARRHLLDFGEVTPAGLAEFGSILHRLVPAVKAATGVQRVYFMALMERCRPGGSSLTERRHPRPVHAFDLAGDELNCLADSVLFHRGCAAVRL